MKRFGYLLAAAMLFVSLAACSAQPQTSADPSHAEENNSSASAPTTSESSAVSSAPQSSQEATESSQGISSQEVEQQVMDSAQKIRFVLSTGEIVVELDDHPGAQALYDLLPLELSFEDYNSTEKIAYLDDELATDGSPDNCDPEVGDLCYYIPWGNLCFFYRDFRHSQSLVPLGTVISGTELLEQLDTESTVTVESAD